MSSSKQNDYEKRLQAIEDKLEIFELIAAHPLSADTGHSEYTLSVYNHDGIFDRGPELDGANGAKDIAAFIERPEHEEAIAGGLAHFTGLPLIDLRDDVAVVTSYLQIVHLNQEGPNQMLPNHGISKGYRIHRVVVNRWEMERREGCWKVAKRTLLPVDGSINHRQLLRKGLDELYFSSSDKNSSTEGS
ncbi:nuclear transport factor 2 family protein (plasmid) [Pantoea sp. C3]|uniref:nuclear transport factor 2 family protein n=1 Tax=Pantoea phytostimulans TaxID=2769024 RepID=UPI0038F7BBBC